MKTTRKILGVLWMAICVYFFATFVQGIYEARSGRLDTLAIQLLFVLLYLSVAGSAAALGDVIRVTWTNFANNAKIHRDPKD